MERGLQAASAPHVPPLQWAMGSRGCKKDSLSFSFRAFVASCEFSERNSSRPPTGPPSLHSGGLELSRACGSIPFRDP